MAVMVLHWACSIGGDRRRPFDFVISVNLDGESGPLSRDEIIDGIITKLKSLARYDLPKAMRGSL